MRAAGTEIGRPLGDVVAGAEHLLGRLQRGDDLRQAVVGNPLEHALADGDRDLVRVERALRREQPLAALVLLADNGRLVGGAVENFLDLALDQRPLLLDDDDQVEALAEAANGFRLDRPGAGELEEAHAEIGGADFVDAEVVERLQDVEVALAGRGNADPRPAATGKHHAVGRVGAQEGGERRQLVLEEPLFLLQGMVAAADREPARRHAETTGNDGRDAVEGAVDGGSRLDRILDAFQPDPERSEARQGEGEEAVVDDLLDPRRRQHRDQGVDEGELGLVRRGRGLAGVVVAHHGDHPAPGGGAGEIGVAERVAGAVDAGALAVPDAEDAVVTAVATELGLLGAPKRGGGEVLVDCRLEKDVRGFERLARTPKLHVEPAQWRAAIAGDVTGRALADPRVARRLHQGQPHDRLRSGDQNPVLGKVVFVVEGDGLETHFSCSRRPAGRFRP